MAPRHLIAVQGRLVPFLACALLAGLAGCHGHYTPCYDCGPTVLYEHEPNDSAFDPDWIGGIAPGDELEIRGDITQWGPDFFDGFAFRTDAPCEVRVALYGDAPFSDLDWCVWDPDLGQYAFCFETAHNPEEGSFAILEAGKTFHVVVSSFAGDSNYRLFVDVVPASYAPDGAAGAQSERAGSALQASAPPPLSTHPAESALRWDRYLSAPALDASAAAPTHLRGIPGKVIAIDPETGRIVRLAAELRAL